MKSARDRALAFCARFGLNVPILQAPMAGASPPALGIAVANAGGMAGFGALMSTPDEILAWARTFRAGSNGAFQINLWAPNPEPARNPVHENEVRAALAGLGPEPPEIGKSWARLLFTLPGVQEAFYDRLTTPEALYDFAHENLFSGEFGVPQSWVDYGAETARVEGDITQDDQHCFQQ
jgi:hypothetical protein